ncbi:MAG: YegS/Rv2252/BmrU family lipid kinase [Anditalea sp.]
MDKEFLLIINPISGSLQNKSETVAQIRETLEKHQCQLKVWETTGKEDQEKILAMIKGNPVDAILVGGGDGTVKMVAEIIVDLDQRVGIIPLGSANGLATSLEIAGMEEAIEAVTNGEEIKMDAIRINGELSLHLSDFGFNASLIKKFEDGGERGMLSYFKSTLAQLFDMQPYRFEIIMDNIIERIEAKMLVIANGNKYGTGALINPVGKIDDGIFEIIALNPESFEDLVKISIALFRGNVNEMESVKIWSASKAEIRNLDQADFQIDGELMGKVEKVNVEVAPNSIRFYKGKDYGISVAER